MVFKNSSSRSSPASSTSFFAKTLNSFISNSSSTEALFLESTTKHRPIRQPRLLEYTTGKRLQSPAMIFLYNPLNSLALNGGSKQHISYSTIPSDHTSPLGPQGSSLHTSGHAQQGVPVCVMANSSFSSFEMLRSPSLATSLEKNILADLMSLWRILCECIFCSPLKSWKAKLHTSISLKRDLTFKFCLIFEVRSPPSANSSTTHKLEDFSSQKASLQPMMQGEVTEARILISLSAFSLSFSLSLSILTCLMAQIWPSTFLLHFLTTPKAPLPNSSRSSKSSKGMFYNYYYLFHGRSIDLLIY